MLGYLVSPNKQFVTKDGAPMTAGHLEVFLYETDDRATTYSDFNGTLNPADIAIDANGRAQVIADDGTTYRIEVYDASGALQWTVSPAFAGGDGAVAEIIADLSGCVRADVEQSFTDAQKALARENIGAASLEDISGDGDRLWAHWENEGYWHDISRGGTFPNSDYVKSEGELTDSQYPYLKAGLYRFTMEIALRNYPSVYDAIEKCDISVNYGSQSLREQSFLFDRTIPYGSGLAGALAETVWFGGIFRMPSEGEVSVSVARRGYYTTASMKCSHIFINKLGD